MEVPLHGAHGAAQCLGQGLHLGPAQPTLVVGVISEGTICRDRLGRDPGEDEGLDLGDTGESGLLRHRRLLFLVRRCALMIEFIKAAGLQAKRCAPPLFLCSFYWCVLYLHGHPRASPRTPLPKWVSNRKQSTGRGIFGYSWILCVWFQAWS